MDDSAPPRPDIRHASDHTLLVGFGDAISPEIHDRVRRAFHVLSSASLPGVSNLHPGYASVLVTYDPLAVGGDELERSVCGCVERASAFELPEPRRVEIPVRYGGVDGPDLAEVAAACGLDPEEVVREHAAGEYLVYFLGFSPGFPYLGGLPARIAAPRRATPRKRVSAGSVAIGGAQTGVYPLTSPGGWQLIGRTRLQLFDPARVPAALLAAGDRVRFVPVSGDEPEPSREWSSPPTGEAGPGPAAAIRVLEPGFQTTVQDLGRPGYAHLGVSASGAADPFSLRIGNWLVGNPPGAPALEMTLTGGTFVFSSPALIAVAGSDFGAAVDGYRIPLWSAVEVRPGQSLTCAATRSGARSTLCVRGGIASPAVLGSASTHLATGIGGHQGRALRVGDGLCVGAVGVQPGPPRRRAAREIAARLIGRDVLRVTRGAQWDRFSEEARAALTGDSYEVREDANRMGLRLSGPKLEAARQGVMLTEGVSLGALQVPADGQPILSFVEHQTTGGYPQIACVIAADLHRAGQLRPRDRVRFVEVSLEEAGAALRELAGAVAALTGAL
jgi:KipI family sensor histidine kinase inhibitor